MFFFDYGSAQLLILFFFLLPLLPALPLALLLALLLSLLQPLSLFFTIPFLSLFAKLLTMHVYKYYKKCEYK
jgi:hypothetical protein